MPPHLGLAATLAATLAHTGPLTQPEAPPQSIFGGVDAGTCDFPSAVAMLDRDTGQFFCTGTLIHPQVVIFAAHCMDPSISWAIPGSVMFGEDVAAPVRQVPVVSCQTHPQWDSGATIFDLAACTLADPVHGVPRVPLIMGCEVDQLQPGTQLVITGFGANSALLDPEGNPLPTGGGIKRFTSQTLTDVVPDANELIMLGPDKGGCFGDSGGPAFARLSDGTWRVLGAASTLHPDALPDDQGEICGLGTVYEIFWTQMAWLEGFAGLDLTPCHDAAGTWAPTAACGGFPTDLSDPDATWGDGCSTAALSGWSATCGAPFSDGPFEPPPPDPPPDPPPPDPPPPDPDPPPPDPPPPDPEPPPPTPPPAPDPDPAPAPEPDPEPDPASAGLDDTDLVDRGCSCAQGQPVPAHLLALLPLLLLRPRRRPRTRTAGDEDAPRA